ncbi:MAG: cytochrome c family protein [Rhodospirillales bacterium]|nr:cytochrome c family protein [Rhodospirillales bacterium]
MNFVKMISALVVAVAVIYLSGFVANKAVHSEELATNAYPIDVPAATEEATIIVAEAEEAVEAVEAAVEEAAPAAEEAATEAAPEMSLTEMIAAADVERGKKLSKACAACHTFDKGGKNGVGPNQWGIIGRKKASVEGFKYSDAMASQEGTWTYEDLDTYLTKPKAMVPGTKMTYAGMKKAEDRAALIAWLREQADSPLPLE